MTRWEIDFSAFRDAWRWIADEARCGARTRAGWPCRCVPLITKALFPRQLDVDCASPAFTI